MSAPADGTRLPVSAGDPLAGWTVSAPLEVRGDVTLVRADGVIPARVAVLRYRGAEPLPRFLEQWKSDGGRWRALQHPNLLPTIETGRVPSQLTCYWAQEDAPGPLLAERLQVHPLFAPDHALALGRQLGAALGAIHRAELLHGEVGPHNVVLVDAAERPRLAWGGLALRLEAAGMDAGRVGARLAEAAPEQLAGKPIGAEADVYGLCALVYRLLAGQPPWTIVRGGPAPGVTATEPLPALPDWVPPAVSRLLSEGLQRDPARRPRLFELVERLDDLEHELRGRPAPLGTWSPAAPPRPSAPVPTPHPASRTMTPAGVERTSTDPALTNTPVSVSRAAEVRWVPPGRSGPAPSPRAAAWWGVASLAAAFGGLLLFGAVLAGGAWWSGRSAPPAPVAAAPVAPAPAPEAAQPAAVAVLTLVSEPPAAEVWEGDRFLGLTPVEVALDPGEGTAERAFELRLAGHATQVVRQPFSTVDVRHSVALRRIPRPGPAPKDPPRPRGGLKVER